MDKIIQIVAHNNLLFTLNENGQVIVYDFTNSVYEPGSSEVVPPTKKPKGVE